MILRKLLYILSTMALVVTPLLSVVACEETTGIEIIPQEKGNLALITEITPLVSDVYAANLLAAEPDEIKGIFEKVAFRIVNSLPNAKGSKEGTDYVIEVKTIFGKELTFDTNLTVLDLNLRTFQITIRSINTSLRLTNQTKPIFAVIPVLDKVDLNLIKTIENISVNDYNFYFQDIKKANGTEIMTMIEVAAKFELAVLGGFAANAKIDVDYKLTIKEENGNDLKSTYNLTNRSLTCQVIYEALPSSMFVIGVTDPPILVTLLQDFNTNFTNKK